MDIYLASPSVDDFFFKAANEAVEALKKIHGEDRFRLIHPPKQLPKDLGTVEANFAQLLNSDVVILNISPERVGEQDIYNPGVLVEYGMVFASDRGAWESRYPRPVHKVYCHDGFKRTNLTPPLGIESVEAYSRSDEGHKALVHSVTALLTERVNLRLDQTAIFGPQPLIAVPPPGGYKILTVSGEQLGK